MKKGMRKLKLHRETLRRLTPPELRGIVGADSLEPECPGTAESQCVTFCYPTRDECGYTYNTQCKNTDISYCQCEQ